VADAVLLLASHFSQLEVGRCLALAILHDKLEIITGDRNPIGRDGTGAATHAFDEAERLRKEALESDALEVYLRKLRDSARHIHSAIFDELGNRASINARFVRAVDKLQALAFVVLKKRGNLDDRHLAFTLRYSEKLVGLFPDLLSHYNELRCRLLRQIAERRGCKPEDVIAGLSSNQLLLPLEDAE
jgi:5'-deoxynucleotidase YfbR-like HD superfamily hydrolase